jgi:microcystin-dependent protein
MAKILSVHTQGPIGTIIDVAGTVAPTGTLLCYGQTLNASTNPIYQPLYNIIGNTYGGTNNTNFVLPDLRGIVVAGYDSMGGTAANRLTPGGSGMAETIGATAGAETHALSSTEMPSHSHTAQCAGGTGGSTLPWNNTGGNSFCVLNGSGVTFQTNMNTGQQAINVVNTGGGGAHQNTQPTMVMNKAICYI